jgi:PAS domain S-box-containing protein
MLTGPGGKIMASLTGILGGGPDRIWKSRALLSSGLAIAAISSSVTALAGIRSAIMAFVILTGLLLLFYGSLFRPWGVIAFTFIFASFEGFIKHKLGYALLTYVFKDFLMILLISAWLLKALAGRHGEYRRTVLDIPLVLFTAVCLIQIFNPNFENWVISIAGIKVHLIYMPLYYMGYYLLQDRPCYDITERATAEQRLQSALQLYQDTLTTIPSSILLLDGNLNILMTNYKYLEEHGFNISDITGKNITEVMTPSFLEENDLLIKLKDIVATGGQLEVLNFRHTSDNHMMKYLNIRIRGISSIGQSAEVLLVIDDITQQFNLEEQIRQAVKLESVGRLAGGVAHDFNNLLTGVTGYAQLLLRKLPADSPMCKDLVQIRELSDRAELVSSGSL